jgi:hypothetical protein
MGRVLKSGDRVDAYVLESLIASGGQGEVWAAVHPETRRRFALKRLSPSAADADAEVRFRREVRLALDFNHPHVVRAHSLRSEIGQSGSATWLAHARQLSAAVAYLHAESVAHRDIKPENVMVADKDGTLVLVDFGLAQRTGDAKTGMAQGTAKYAPPDVEDGLPPDATDADHEERERGWDVFSLALVLYELTTGGLPEKKVRSDPERWARAMCGVTAWGRSLRELLARCGSLYPSRRPRGDEVVRALAAGEASESEVRRKPPALVRAPTRAPRAVEEPQWPAYLVIGLLCSVIFLGARELDRAGLLGPLTSENLRSARDAGPPEAPVGGVADADVRDAQVGLVVPDARVVVAGVADARVRDATARDATPRDARPKDAPAPDAEEVPSPEPPARVVIRGYEYRWSQAARVYLGRAELTAAHYAACVLPGCSAPRVTDGCTVGVSGSEALPATCINSDQAKAVCEYYGGRLPSSAEWGAEASARGLYAWGDTPEASCTRAVMADASGPGCGGGGPAHTCSRSPKGDSASGLCDMNGNVFEWATTVSGGGRVVRGGSWFLHDPQLFRSSLAHEVEASLQLNYLGVRCARPSSP